MSTGSGSEKKEYEYYISYTGSTDTCLELHTGKVFLPTPIETDDDIASVEKMIHKETGNHRPALLGFSLLQVREVKGPRIMFQEGRMAERTCG